MGRAFEYRKASKMKRWDFMSKAFSKLGKEISIAVKLSGPDPKNNPRLRIAIQNAKGVNMPKDRVDAAINRAESKDEKELGEIVYEGYAPHGVPVMIETATDNPNRTIANLRVIFSRNGGSIGTSGSVGFMFERKGVFKLPINAISLEDLELDLIDAGAEDIYPTDDALVIQTDFTDFGKMQKFLEDQSIEVLESSLQRLPGTYADISEDQENEVLDFIEKLEEDEDVQNVFHNLKGD